MVETSPSNAGGEHSVPGQGTTITHASQSKNQNINNSSNTVTNTIKTLKMAHIKKKKSKKKALKPRSSDSKTSLPLHPSELPLQQCQPGPSQSQGKKKKKPFVRLPSYLELWSINVKLIIFQAFFILNIHLLEVGHSFMSLSFSLN